MLAGTRVLDLTWYLPGPYATRLLSDHGADVVKVEGPRAPDPLRAWPPREQRDVDDLSAAFRALNRGKRALAADLKSERGRELLLRLVEKADVLVESFRPGTMERLGLDARVCRERNPRIVYCSISGFGQDGPYRDRPGHDVDYMAYSGVLSISVDRSGRSVLPAVQFADTLGAYSALSGILIALLARERTGRGAVVDAAMLDALVGAQALQLPPHLAGAGAEPGRLPLSGGFPCYGVFTTADGRAVALGALEPRFWKVFCERIGKSSWIERQFDQALVPELESLFRTRTRADWRALLEDERCCLAPVLGYDELGEDPQVRARGLLAGGDLAPPVRFVPPLPPPAAEPPFARRVGEHTAEVLADWLGLASEELGELERGGVISCAR